MSNTSGTFVGTLTDTERRELSAWLGRATCTNSRIAAGLAGTRSMEAPCVELADEFRGLWNEVENAR